MKEFSQYKFKFNQYLEDLYQSDKPLIIYKVDDGYNIYTDFSKKIILTKKNLKTFLYSIEKKNRNVKKVFEDLRLDLSNYV